MESIIEFIFLTLFVILIYNYSLYYFKYHKDTKKQYISYESRQEIEEKEERIEKRKEERKEKRKEERIEKRKEERIEKRKEERKEKRKEERKEKLEQKLEQKLSMDKCNNQCKYNSCCVSTDTGYDCICKQGYSGKLCEFENDKSLGVRVILDDEKMVPQIVYTRKSMFDTQNFQWNDFI